MKKVLFAIQLICLCVSVLAQKAELMIPKGHTRDVADYASSADENILFSFSPVNDSRGEIKIWDIKSGRLLKTLTEKVAWNTQIVGLSNKQGVGFCSFSTGEFYSALAPAYQPKLIATLPYGFVCNKIVALPDGQHYLLAGSGLDGQFRCPFVYKLNYNTGAYSLVAKIPPYSTDPKVSFDFILFETTTDGRYINAQVTSSSPEKRPYNFFVFDVQTGATVRAWAGDGSFYRVYGKGLMARTQKKITETESELTARIITLPDFKEGTPYILPKGISYNYIFDEGQNTLTYFVNNTANLNIVKIDATSTQKLQALYSENELKKRSIGNYNMHYLHKTKKIIAQLTEGDERGGIHVIDAKNMKIERVLGNISQYVEGAKIQYNAVTDALLINGGETKVFEIGKASGNHKVYQFKYFSKEYIGRDGSAAWSPDGTKLAYTDNNKGEVGIFDANNLSAKPQTAIFTTKLNLRSPLIWNPDSKKFIFGDLSKCIEVDATTPSVRQRTIGYEGYQSQFHLNSKNGQYIVQPAYRYNANENFIGKEINYLVCYNASSGIKMWQSSYTSKGGLIPISFIDNDKTLVAIEGFTGTLQYFNATTGQHQGSFGEPLSNFKADVLFNGAMMASSLSADGTKSVVIGGDKVVIYDIVNKIKVAELPKFSTLPNGICFVREDKFLAYTSPQGIGIFDIAKKKTVADIILFQNLKEWVVTTPDGRFDASQDIQDIMYYVKGDQTIPLSALFEKFYTPQLLNRVLNGEVFEPIPVNINTLKEAPLVNISVDNSSRNLVVADDITAITVQKEQINIRVQAECPSDLVTEIRLFQNGKLVQTTRNLVVEDEKTSEKIMTRVFAVNLENGDNHFKAIAFNTERTESQPAELVANYKTPGASNVITQNTEAINLHLVVIGINKYKNPRHNLNYAIADASSFKAAIEKSGSAIFTKINVAFINDENATKENISAELNKVKANASAKDVFIFYYAGHGVMNDKKEFYLVPHDVIQLYGADGALAEKGINSNQLQQFSKDIKAQKQLFILDACQSAAALENIVAARGSAEEKAIAQLARATGTHWLTASGSEQFASEFSQLGHGTFTYVLLEALSGKADTGDKKITVREIDGYLQEHVPEITTKYKGTPQYPASYGYGNDFPIGVVK